MATNEVFLCQVCAKTFGVLGRYNQHRNTHSKPYACEHCQRAFGSRADLHRHVKTQHRIGNARFACNIQGCGASVSRKDNMPKHMRSFHPEKLDADSVGKHHTTQDHSKPSDVTSSLADRQIDAQATFDWWQAASIGNLRVIESMLAAGFDVNSQAGDGNTALHCAAYAGQTEVVEYLLEKVTWIDLHFRNKGGETALFEAAAGGSLGCTTALLQAGATVANFRPGVLSNRRLGFVDHVVRLSNVSLVRVILNVEATPQFKDKIATREYALAVAAAKSGELSILRFILDLDPAAFRTQKYGLTMPIYYAVKCGQADAARMLLSLGFYGSHGGKRTADIANLIETAARKGHHEVLKVLFEHDSTAEDAVNEQSLFAAVSGARAEIVTFFLALPNVNIDYKDYPFNNTALHHVSRYGYTDIVTILLRHGARHDLLNCYNQTPFQIAFWGNRLDIARLLWGHERAPESQEVSTEPLSLFRVAQHLIETGSMSVNSHSSDDPWTKPVKSLLHLAADCGEVELAMYVLSHKDWDSRNIDKKFWLSAGRYETALELARRHGHTDIVDILLSHGATDHKATEQPQQAVLARGKRDPDLINTELEVDIPESDEFAYNSDSEAQSYSYIDEYFDSVENEPPFPAPDHSRETTDASTWMGTVLAG